MDAVPEGVDHVRVGSRAYWAAVARAKYLVNNVNFADTVVKREGQIHLQTHHGTPLKTMGLDQQKYPASTHMNFAKLLERCDRWDFSLSSNSFSTAVWSGCTPARSPAWRPATRATTSWSTPRRRTSAGPAPRWGSPTAPGPCCTCPPTASTSPVSHRPSTSRGSPTSWAPT
ncbi:hypothetical protein SHKM778_78710 [Streptomyces sp. KM77-8]|uniref:Uncharacterized protein n=1 Tax=Streptomyces haneummycinicus TaxID=3074435 RepID=A0AAT9HW41_9ACTN